MTASTLLQRRISPGYLWVVATVGLVFAGQWLQARVHLNHDVSWIAHSARWLLDGRSFGTDVLDPNPPLIWWMSLPAAALANSGLLDEPAAVRVVFWSYFLISATIFFRVLADVDPRDRAASMGWWACFLIMATLAPGFSFGQREYLSVLFAMPYLASACVRLQRFQNSDRLVYAAVGLLAGIGFAIKPFFLAVPLLVEGLLAARLGWRSLFRLESVVLALTVLAYVLAVLILVPQYVTFTLPLMRSIYWAFDSGSFSMVLSRYWTVTQPLLYGALVALLSRTWTRQHTVVLLAGLGYSVSYFIQAKGFVYHAYPVLLFCCVFLGISVASGLVRVWNSRRDQAGPIPLLLVFAILVLVIPPAKHVHDGVMRWYFQFNLAHGETGQFRQEIISVVNHFARSRQSYFFAFSTHPFPGFPTASYTAAEWSGRASAQGILAAYARMDEVSGPGLRESIIRAAELQRRMVIEDMERRPPAVVFVERSRSRLAMNGRAFDDVAFYLQDPEFQRIWNTYEEYPPLGPLRVFVRRRQ